MKFFLLYLFISLVPLSQGNTPEELYRKGKEQEGSASTSVHYQRALDYYKQSAELGFAPAQVAVAKFYELGFGVEKSYQKAAAWYQRATEQKTDMESRKVALYRLASLYENGKGVDKNLERASRYYLDAWGAGHPQAQLALKRVEAHRWLPSDLPTYRLYLAKNGDAKAQYELGKMYLSGEPNQVKWFKAKKWLEQAASQNIAEAQVILGKIYEEGKWTSKNENIAYKYYEQAARNNNPAALAWLDNKQASQMKAERMVLTSSRPVQKVSSSTETSLSEPSLDYFAKGKKAFDEKNYEEAYNHFQKVSPYKSPLVLKYVAQIHKEALVKVANENDALLYLNRYLETQPDDAEAYFLLGQIYLKRNQHNEAKRYFDIAQKKGYQVPEKIWLAVK